MEANMSVEVEKRFIVDQGGLPELYPTHLHEAKFWEALGRTVATFGFLEETLGKAIFSFTATKPYREDEIQKAYAEWLPKLEHALTDQLGSLINSYGKAVREHPSATVSNLDELLDDLRDASKIRNVLCHGSWRSPDAAGVSIPFFVNCQKEVFDTAVDIDFLNRVQRHAVGLVCAVVDSVSHMGWQFPGCSSPGRAIWHDG
jgi:hypothetical protein